jgi:hypothetical protein
MILAFAVSVFVAAVVINTWFEIEQHFKRKKFTNYFTLALKRQHISSKDIDEFSNDSRLSIHDTIVLLRKLKVDFLTKNTYDLDKDHINIINSYIEKYQQEKPFDGIPPDIKAELNQLRTKIDIQSLLPLTKQIHNLLYMNEKIHKRERLKSTISIIFGFIGFIFLLIEVMKW